MSRNEPKLTHLDDSGRARMVDVGSKPATHRRARAHARVRMQGGTLQKIKNGTLQKGDVLAVARVAGIQAAKQTPNLIPLCHVVPLDYVAIDIRLDLERGWIDLESVAECRASTGVEMEAIMAASIAAITIYDMCKSVDRSMTIEGIELLEKSGGRSGDYRRQIRSNETS